MRILSPAPHGAFGLEYGSIKKPYAPGNPHRGQDWQWRYAAPWKSRELYAGVSGRVTKVVNNGSYNSGWGNVVEIEVTHGVIWGVAHIKTGTVVVREGQWISAGAFIGTMGDTGDVYGVHAHEYLWIHGQRANPNTYRSIDLPGTAASGGGSSSDNEEDDMAFIANVKGGNFYLVNGKTAHVLGAKSGARTSGMPIINYPDDYTVSQLKNSGVTGIGNH